MMPSTSPRRTSRSRSRRAQNAPSAAVASCSLPSKLCHSRCIGIWKPRMSYPEYRCCENTPSRYIFPSLCVRTANSLNGGSPRAMPLAQVSNDVGENALDAPKRPHTRQRKQARCPEGYEVTLIRRIAHLQEGPAEALNDSNNGVEVIDLAEALGNRVCG